MERLTKVINACGKTIIVYTQGKYEDTTAGEMEHEDIRNVMKRLSDYEDTGLTPEQVRELKERDTAKMCKQSIFDHDSITCVCGSDMDKDVEFMFCPWCGQRLKKWEE